MSKQKPIRLIAVVAAIWAKPRAITVAVTKCQCRKTNCFGQSPHGTTVAANKNLCNISACTTLFNPELPSALCLAIVRERVPVNISDVPGTAGSHEADWYDRTLLPRIVDELSFGQHSAMDQHSCPHDAVTCISKGTRHLAGLRRCHPEEGAMGETDPAELRTGRFLVRIGVY